MASVHPSTRSRRLPINDRAQRDSLHQVAPADRNTAPPADPRDPDDPVRLAEEARDQRVRMGREISAAAVPIATEPATIYRP